MTGVPETLPAVRVRARAEWPEPGDAGAPAAVRGFALTSFAPMVVQVAARCLNRRDEPPAADERTAIILVSSSGDRETAVAVAAAVDAGRRVPPMLFFQSVPNSVLGHIATEWGLTGPVASLSPVGDPLADGLAVADALFLDGDATAALLIVAERGPDPAVPGTAVAVLVEPATVEPAAATSAGDISTEGGRDD